MIIETPSRERILEIIKTKGWFECSRYLHRHRLLRSRVIEMLQAGEIVRLTDTHSKAWIVTTPERKAEQLKKRSA